MNPGGETSAAVRRRRAERLLAEFLAQRPRSSSTEVALLARDHPDLEPDVLAAWEALKELPFFSLLDGKPVPPELSFLVREPDPADSPASLPLSSSNADHAGTEELLARLRGRQRPADRYHFDGELARGGMGVVSKIWDADLRRHVALKALRAGRSAQACARGGGGADEAGGPVGPELRRLVARFLDEALVTAQLDHPGIVPVHELGCGEDGGLYFTMKLVKGQNLREIIDLASAGAEGWTLNRAVGVLRRVCEAVAYAHSKGVIHRDIKPANIMVGRFGETYLMDWGLARVLGDEPLAPPPPVAELVAEPPPGWDDAAAGAPPGPDSWLFTRDGDVVGTPPYMAPEQARGDVRAVDERCDVYSLGAILYHLLTGRIPYVAGDEYPMPWEVLVRVQREEPDPVEQLAPAAPPTLVAICKRAMARRVGERFPSAAELGAALADYLEDISEAREEARRQAERARLINEFLLEMLGSADPAEAQGREISVREVLDRAASRVEGALPGHPLNEAVLRSTIGGLYMRLGRHADAEPHLARALLLREAHLEPCHVDACSARADLGLLHLRQGRPAEARVLLERTLALQLPAGGADKATTLRTQDILATVLRAEGRLEEAAALWEQVLGGRRALLGETHPDTAATMLRLGWLLRDMGRADDALQLVQDAHRALLEHHGETHPRTLVSMSDLAGLLQSAGRLQQAEEVSRRVVALQTRVHGEDHPHTLVALNNLGWLLKLRGALAEAEVLLRRAVDGLTARDGERHPTRLSASYNLALVLLDTGRVSQAVARLRDVVRHAAAAQGDDHPLVGRYRFGLAQALCAAGERVEAREHLGRALEVFERRLGARHPWALEALALKDALSAS